MRTTITIDDDLYHEIRNLSYEKHVPFKTILNMVLASGLHNFTQSGKSQDFSQMTYAMGKPYSEYDMIKALETAGDLEIAEIRRKMELRK